MNEAVTAMQQKGTSKTNSEPPIGGLISFGLGLIVLIAGGLGAWATYAPLSGAVIASGAVVVDSNVKKVQHPTGGVVGKIFVRNGDWVHAGDTLMHLDDTQTRANLGVVVSQLVQLRGRKARLEAERDGREFVTYPSDFEASDPEAPAIAAGESSLFAARKALKNSQVSQLRERVGQFRQEIIGLTAQRDAKKIEIDLMKEELEKLVELRRKELIPQPRVLAAQRDLTKLQGEWGSLEAQIARALGSISEISLQIIAVDQTVQTDASKEIRDIEAKLAELVERRTAAQDQLARIDIRSPQTGAVHELSVHTVGGVISAGEQIMLIVPTQESLAIEVRVSPIDIDQIMLGQKATLRFTAFNQRTTPEFSAEVARVGADITKEPQTNSFYYLVRLKISETDVDKLRKIRLVPGMPVESFIETHDRTMASYLLKPLMDQVARAFKED
jgi:HlyD family secretion protein